MDYSMLSEKDREALHAEQEKLRGDIIQSIKSYRKSNHITQQELAERAGLAQPNVTRFESCKYNPTLDFIVRIANALDLDVEITLKEKTEKRNVIPQASGGEKSTSRKTVSKSSTGK
jgi:transcriptional regulator with XRE-family HTH domain